MKDLAEGTERTLLSARHYLLVFEGELSSRVFPLPVEGTVVIGRGDDVTLRVTDSSVSRRHATITRVDGQVMVADLESQNGTFVNGERVVKPRPLVAGDTVALGEVTLIYHASIARSAPPEPPRTTSATELRTIAVGNVTVVIADPAMAQLYELVERLAASERPVLVCGEPGSGKEVVACALHQMSPRAGRQLVSLNCAAIHEDSVESELFGYERGAFSGADDAKPGLLETADGGTVFLDGIGDVPAAVQAKLLQIIETKRVLRLGDVRERSIDVRIIAATNRDLVQDVVSGRFRRDLFFQLSGGTVWLPPLRDRQAELPILANLFLRDACTEHHRAPLEISPAAMRQLLAMPWSGNVRELKHLMEYLSAAITESVIQPHHLDRRARPETPHPVAETPQFRSLAEEIRELEQRRISAALSAANGNQRVAAELLQMPLRTFVFKLKQYGLRRVDEDR